MTRTQKIAASMKMHRLRSYRKAARFVDVRMKLDRIAAYFREHPECRSYRTAARLTEGR